MQKLVCLSRGQQPVRYWPCFVVSQQSLHVQQNHQEASISQSNTHACLGRRQVLLQTGTVLLSATTAVSPVEAGVLDGAVEFWKSRQRQNGGFKLLAPIKVAQQRLADAQLMLQSANSPQTVTQVLQVVRASSLNCYVFEADEGDSLETKASLMTQQLKLSDPCTFRIIVKNAVDFAPQAVKTQGSDILDELLTSYQKLDAYLDMARTGNSEAVPKATAQIAATIEIIDNLERFVKTALGV